MRNTIRNNYLLSLKTQFIILKVFLYILLFVIVFLIYILYIYLRWDEMNPKVGVYYCCICKKETIMKKREEDKLFYCTEHKYSKRWDERWKLE